MITPNEIIAALKTDMEAYIKSSLGYNTDPLIKYGIYPYTEVELTPPTVCYSDIGIELIEGFGDMGHAWLNILVYGYSDSDGIDNTNTIRNLASDVLHFIYIDFSYTDGTEIVSNVDIFGSGATQPASLFTLEIRVKYDFTHDNINTAT